MRLLPDLPEVCFVEVGDFTGAAIREAVEHGLTDMVFVGMVGKLAKLAAGVLMTHYTRSAVDRDLLLRITAEAGADPAVVEAVREANTARHAYEQWETAGCTSGWRWSTAPVTGWWRPRSRPGSRRDSGCRLGRVGTVAGGGRRAGRSDPGRRWRPAPGSGRRPGGSRSGGAGRPRRRAGRAGAPRR